MEPPPPMPMMMAHQLYNTMPMYGTSSPSISDPHSSQRVPVVTMDSHGVMHAGSDLDRLDRNHLSANKRRKVVYLCESCGTSYTEKRALARHKHTNQHRRNLGLPPAQRYPCTTCEKSFSRDHDRVRHENETHKGLKRSAQRATIYPSKDDSPPHSDSTAPSDSLSPSDPDSQNTPASSATTHSRTPSNACNAVSAFDAGDWTFGATDQQPVRPLGASVFSLPTPYTTGNPNPSLQSSSPPTKVFTAGGIQERSWLVDDSDSDDDEIVQPSAGLRVKALRDRIKGHDTYDRDDDHDNEDEEDDDDDDNVDRFVYATMRSTSTADSAIDMDWSQEREPKFPTIVTYDLRGESRADSNDPETAADEQRDQLAPLSESHLTAGPRHKHGSVITRRGKAENVSGNVAGAVFCIFCKQPFEDDPDLLLPHLREHLDALKGEHKCKVCNIGFTHRADLDRHKVSVDFFGSCGFPFDHSKQCTGHHPPSSRDNTQELNDRDSIQLFTQLRNWEHAQLRAYISEIQDLLSKQSSRASTCYSVEALFRNSRDSFASVALSINTCDSAPCDNDMKRGIGGLQQRLRMMSLKNTPSSQPISKSNSPTPKPRQYSTAVS